MCLRGRDLPPGAIYWNDMATDGYAGSASSQGRLQAAFEPVKEQAFDEPR
jgi:hypothetical protein